MKRRFYILAMILAVATAAMAQSKIRYVKADGNYKNDGSSWSSAKKNIQDAINDLVANGIDGEVWVAAGTYTPTESTESSGVNQLNMAFKIPEGITVRGGFAGTETTAEARAKDANGQYTNKTILSGSLKSDPTFTFTDGKFKISFYENCYHVVWFAMNGFTGDRANPLNKVARLEGCTVTGGHAFNTNISSRSHNAYGGGIYMVANSYVENCIVENCDASCDGGGIYMDGGGEVRHTTVRKCQALGVGIDFGYGGGICAESAEAASPYYCIVTQSVINNCVGRMGGGMAFKVNNETNKNHLASNSTLIHNNTSTNEGGGVYLYRGGGLANLTIVANKTNGSGVNSNGVENGQTGGVFCYDYSNIGNCVIWGNARKEPDLPQVQYATSRSSNSLPKHKFRYNALSYAELADWSGTARQGVTPLCENNTGSENRELGHPIFNNPSATAGYTTAASDWHIYAESALRHAGIYTIDLDHEGETPAPPVSYDIDGHQYNPRCTLGSYCSPEVNTATLGMLTTGSRIDIFVDPSYIYTGEEQKIEGHKGESWTTPTRFLANVLEYINKHTSTFSDKQVYVHVKEGVVNNTNSYATGRIRTSSIDIPSNVTILGGYSEESEDTDLSQRNPLQYPTIITGDVTDNEFEYNVAHLITLNNASNVTLDGFQIRNVNASSDKLTNTDFNGAAITIKGGSGITFKNILIANCQGEKGVAVYADDASADFENCIFHNNTSTNLNGIIYNTGTSSLAFNHCDVLRNVGYASYMDGSNAKNTWDNSIFYGNFNTAKNDTNTDAGGGIDFALPAFAGTTANATGSRCMFDANSASFASQFGGNDTDNQWQYNLQYAFIDGTGQGYPRFVNPTKNSGITIGGDNTYYGRATSFEPHNNNPIVNNASFTDAHTTWGTDITTVVLRDFGGLPDIGAVESHLASRQEEGENAYVDGQKPYGSVIYVRDYINPESAPDVPGTRMQTYDRVVTGTEGHETITYNKNEEDKGLYIKVGNEYHYLDGNSWMYAINGNAQYSGTTEAVSNATFVSVTDPAHPGTQTFSGFYIKSGNYYMYLDGTTPKLTQNQAAATVWSVGGVTTATGMGAGARSLKANGTNSYLTVSGNNKNRNLSTTNTATNLTLASSGGGYTIYYNSRYININGSNLALVTSGPTAWTFTPAYDETPAQYIEQAYESNATEGESVAAETKLTDPMKLHVYHSIEDFKNSPTKITYKFGSNGGGNYAYTAAAGDEVMKRTTEVGSADEFALIATGTEDKYFIYNKTRNKFVYYIATSQTTANAGTVKLIADINGKNATWWVVADGDGKNNLYIKPGTLARSANATWNYYGGSDKDLGLAGTEWGDSKWKATVVTTYKQYKVTNHVPTNVNGLQYAVNNAYNAMQNVSVIRQVTDAEHYGGNSKTTTRTYYDFTPTAEQPEVSVYVGAGIYTKLDGGDETGDNAEGTGYLIRNHVKVYGAFPAKGDPGMDERHPQLSSGIAMSLENQAAHLNYLDFETILQTNTDRVTADNKEGKHMTNVLAQPRECQVTMADDSNEPRDRVVYEGAEWDGFTLQNGFMHGVEGSGNGRRWGGGGAAIYENIVLRNCIVRKNYLANYTAASAGRGAGIYCDGGIVENCYLLDNQSSCSKENFGGGIYMIQGELFNSVIAANNITSTSGGDYGAGIYIESARFYNNTMVNNTGASAIGIYTNSKETADLTVYNSIVIAAEDQNLLYRADASNNTPTKFVNCYLKCAGGSGEGNYNMTNGVTITDSKVFYNTELASYNPFVLPYATAVETYDYRIEQKNPENERDINCVNAGTETLERANHEFITLPDFDMDYTDRIQDCRVDIGAYEYNGAYGITPHITLGTAQAPQQAVYYVTPDGYGMSSGADPENAACAPKLQKVIDAAGRYKYEHPNTQVIVKVAESASLHAEGDHFTYYACRTTDPSDQDVRVWSIIVPRGVEVWGGYTDVASSGTWSNSNNGFYTGTKEAPVDNRNVLGYPTYFDSYYYNKAQKNDAYTYHVVTFTDRVYDGDGKPYLKTDLESAGTLANLFSRSSSYNGQTNEDAFLHMSDKITGANVQDVAVNGYNISSRAVIDGIFVSGGNANAQGHSGSQIVNINQYGGGAIVNEFAHVRNCILTDNAAKYGGALALKDMGIVSGCLVMENKAEYGGGIYVFEDGTKLSDGSTVDTAQGEGSVMDWRMPHVFTTTVVDNTATKQGGGIWFTESEKPNVRVASSVFWNNTCDDQADVYGNIFPEKEWEDHTSTNEFYPFSYSAIENLRASGSNNLSVSPNNINGVRFAQPADDKIDFNSGTQKNFAIIPSNDDPMGFGYYGISNYSILNRTGMPVQFYESMLNSMAVSPTDFTGRSRTGNSNILERRYVEIGARALDKVYPQKEMMLRIFVAKAEDVDMDAAQAMMQLAANQDNVSSGGVDYNDPSVYTDANYYSQEGSSFAYPMQSLQDALDYVQSLRSKTSREGDDNPLVDTFHGNNLPFEILVAKGTYYPTRSITDNYAHSYSNTFVIPEGVTIVGGFDSQGGCTFSGNSKTAYSYYGRYQKRNTTALNTYSGNTVVDGSINTNVTNLDKNDSKSITGMTLANLTIQEWPIEDIQDRRKHDDNNGNSIIEPWEFKNQTILSGNTTNTTDKGVYHVITAVADQNVVGMLPKPSIGHTRQETLKGTYATSGDKAGYMDYEEGQTIRLNGLVISGGYALGYEKNALDTHGNYTYYQGGGIFVEGNRYCDDYNKGTSLGTHYSPVHQRIYAVGYRDIPFSITNCKFLNNNAGYGGAISSNCTLDIFASSFERNLAAYGIDKGVNDGNDVEYPGEGGAIHATHQLSVFNTLFANNEARGASTYDIEPQKHLTFRVSDPSLAFAVPRGAGGAIQVGTAGQFHIVNCDFVRNKAFMYPAVQTMNPTAYPSNPATIQTPEYSQLINTVAWGNEVDEAMLAKGNEAFKFASKLMVNARNNSITSYSPSFNNSNAPASQSDLDANFQESAWFCAYEDGVGFTPHNENDFRELDYKPFTFASLQLSNFKPEGSEVVLPYQNCNVLIAGENDVLEGPNFRNPSLRAGIDGYMESADWSPARLNNLTDNGSGRLEQICDPTQNYKVTFQTYTTAPTRSVNVSGTNGYTIEKVGDYKNVGGYTMTHYVAGFPEYQRNLSIGHQYYMQSTTVVDEEGNPQVLHRIAPMPDPKAKKAYIDIGVYEYMHVPLVSGDEVDVLWVSTKEHPENGLANGLTWETPTSDLQRAIETLLSSRNGHKKEIRIMEGEYAPYKTVEVDGTNYQSFFIDTKGLNESAFVPQGQTKLEGVSSLTIKGGYSSEIPFEQDVEKYQTVIRQQESTSANTDHLLYIADATQRYGTNEHCKESAGFNNGAWLDAGHKTTNTFPIEIDGITFINSNAGANVDGSAIYYPDMAKNPDGDANQYAVSPTSTHITNEVHYYTREQGTSETDADYDAAASSPNNAPTDFFKIPKDTSTEVATPAKIIISKVIVLGSGKEGDNVGEDTAEKLTGSAVYIGKMGGNALIYNSVFHSNYGNPLEAYNATTVNNTFAENAGVVVLKNASYTGAVESQILNSILWLNNPTGTQDTQGNKNYGVQYVLADATGTEVVFANNAYTGGNIEFTDYKDQNIINNNYNVGLVAENNDVINGPNFVDPFNEDIEKRYFNLLPSLRILNKGDQTDSSTPTNYYVAFDPANPTNQYVIYDLALVTTTGKEAAYTDRLIGTARELGAYEYEKGLQRVIYVDPNKGTSGDGNSWENALGKGKIQDAIDIAAVYNVNEGNAQGKEAYVFVKGASETNKGLDTEETLTLRNGVTVYGSIPSTYNTEIEHADAVNGVIPYEDDKIAKFETQMKYDREGVANPSANKTTINGIATSPSTTFVSNCDTPADDHIAAVIDGFDVTKGDTDAPVIDINPTVPAGKTLTPIVLTNIIVHDNTIGTSGVNVANVDNALIYEVLMRDNFYDDKVISANPLTVLNLGKDAYAVNVTVEGETKYKNVAVPLNGGADATAEAESHVHASLVNYASDAKTDQTLSKTHYALEDKNLNYQLEEGSVHIDGVDQSQAGYDPKHYLPENLRPYVNYTTDRDLLGNPRLLTAVTDASMIDRGAFETWKVIGTYDSEKETYSKNDFLCGDNGTIADKTGYVVAAKQEYTNDEQKIINIKKHFYPHDGSVVYIMAGNSLVIDAVDKTHEVKPTPHNPGFMLVQEGANFYGNGRPATCAFVAVERRVRKGGAVVSIPYEMFYEAYKPYTYDADKRHEYKLGNQIGVGAPSYVTDQESDNFGVLSITPDAPNSYTYDSSKRSDWKYAFAKESSPCWTSIGTGTATDANNGVLYVANDNMYAGEATEVLLRFTGKGVSMSDYIYTEEGMSKDVVLTQYNNGGRDGVGNGNTDYNPDFTDKDDMGWNAIGIPYLVSDYKPYEKVDAETAVTVSESSASATYRMDIPHTLWMYYDGKRYSDGTTSANGDGGFYSVNSWEDNTDNAWHLAAGETATIWVGEGFFTQTANLASDGKEALSFYLPRYVAPSQSPSDANIRLERYYFTDGIEDAPEDEFTDEGAELIRTEFYTTDGIRVNKPKHGMVIMREVYSNGTTRSHKMYIK